MNYWNNLRVSGVNLSERFCIKCKKKKSRSIFPKHEKYNKSRICFECLGEIKCTSCLKTKKYDEFKEKYKGSRKSKTVCWNCFKEKDKERRRKNYSKRKQDGTLPKINRDDLPMHSLLWSKISSKKSNSNNRYNERSSEVEITSTQFKSWFEKNYDGTCDYCKVKIDDFRKSKFLNKIRPHIKNFGIDRKNTKIGYRLDNIVICCHLCNSVKGYFFSYEEFKEIGKKYIKKLYD